MEASKWEKPATALHGEPASKIEQLGGELNNILTANVISAQLSGSDTAVAGSIKGGTAFDLCRQLLAAGANPDAGLVCWRNGVVALRVRSLRIGARHTVRETANDGPRLVRWKAFQDRDVSAPSALKATGCGSA